MTFRTVSLRTLGNLRIRCNFLTARLFLIAFVAGSIVLVSLTGCSMGQIVARTSASILDGGIEAMNREADLTLAAAAIPAQLKILEGIIIEDPTNSQLRMFAAQGLYGYAFGFVEMHDRARAGALFRRGFDHGYTALQKAGVPAGIENMMPDELRRHMLKLSRNDLPLLFWTASCWAKWIDMNRDDPGGISQLGNVAIMMGRVLELDETFYYGGPHIFFAGYYGSRAPMFGGDYKKSAEHFDRAHNINDGSLLISDVLRAEILSRQQFDRQSFHEILTRVLSAPDDLLPEMTLANQIAKQRARILLSREDEWF